VGFRTDLRTRDQRASAVSSGANSVGNPARGLAVSDPLSLGGAAPPNLSFAAFRLLYYTNYTPYKGQCQPDALFSIGLAPV